MDSRRPRIVIADDEPAIADTLAMILTGSGYECFVAYGGIPASECVQSLAPDLLITDVVMPDKNGIELALETRKLAPNCVVLLFSGSARSPDLIGAAGTQASGLPLLAKPVDVDVLLKTVAGLLQNASPGTARKEQ